MSFTGNWGSATIYVIMSHNKNNFFLATIKERYCLCKPGSSKNTQHVVLDLKGSNLTYAVGDCIGIKAHHDSELVAKTLKAMRATGLEIIHDKNTGEAISLHDFLVHKANISDVSKKFFGEICKRQTNPEKKAFMENLLQEGHKEQLKDYFYNRELWDVLVENEEVTFDLQELCNMLMPLLPRLYSIASSMKCVGDEVHLTIALVHYDSNGHRRRGVCTHYLCDLVPLHQPVVPIYFQPHHGFTLPTNSDAPIIMVGPGTGVAPFRSFMQERIVSGATGKNWLIFGERNRATDFLYEEYWNELAAAGKLRLDVAFSRDQSNKVYVQDRMVENGEEIYSWLEQGAYFYVCGDAAHMAKDVDAALHHIIQKHGKLNEHDTKLYVKHLRAEKRYLRDIY